MNYMINQLLILFNYILLIQSYSVRKGHIDHHIKHETTDLKPPNYVDISSLTKTDQGPQSYSNGRNNLPECAVQQVCNAIFVRMNHTQNLCDCSRSYKWDCSNDLDANDGHTIELSRRYDRKVYTQVKLCEPLITVRSCKLPTDWTLLALQSERTGKAHYVVVCRCPEWGTLEGPYTHNHPPYARIPGIRVYGMLCVQGNRIKKQLDEESNLIPFPWDKALSLLNSTSLEQLHKP